MRLGEQLSSQPPHLPSGTERRDENPAARTVSREGQGRDGLVRTLPWFTGAWVLLQLISLRLGLLNAFFFDSAHADVQGIDYYSLPKAWQNLAAGRSLYGTFDPPTYGPHFTWYLAHPLLAVVLGWPLSRMDPADSYGVFTLLSLAVMAASAWWLARESDDPLIRRLIWLLFLGAFPTYLTFWVGNVQSFTVLGLTLLFVGMLRTARWQPHARWFVRAGLLMSLFTKPVVLLMLPLLLLMKETRRAAFDAVAVYVPVSLLFLVVPALNPERISLGRTFWLSWHPGFVREHMNIFANGLRLTPDMRDNSVHWFNLIAQSGFRLQHVDVYSLPVFLDGLSGNTTPGWIYVLPTLLVLGLSVGVGRMHERAARREAALLLVLAASLDFFLSYPTVWEYQYTAVLPVAAVLLMMRHSLVLGRLWPWCVGLAACSWLPSLYFLSGSAIPSADVLAMARLDRVLPVTFLFALLLWCVGRSALRAGQRVAA